MRRPLETPLKVRVSRLCNYGQAREIIMPCQAHAKHDDDLIRGPKSPALPI